MTWVCDTEFFKVSLGKGAYIYQCFYFIHQCSSTCEGLFLFNSQDFVVNGKAVS